MSLGGYRRLSWLAGLAAAIAVGFGGCGVDIDFGGDDNDVSGAAGPYTAQAPQGWDEASEAERAEVGGQSLDAVEASSGEQVTIDDIGVTSLWAADRDDPMSPSIVVFREPVPAGMGGNQFIDVSLANARRAFGDSLLGSMQPGDPVEVDGEPAETYDYRVGAGDGDRRNRAAFIFHGDDAYTLTMSAPEEEFAEAERALAGVLDSWRWTG
jgi:hypothetical protein